MRRLVVVALAACVVGIAGLAYAQAAKHVTADFSSLAASGVAGKVTLTEQQSGHVNVVLQARNLTPGTEYVAQFYTTNGGCSAEPATAQNLVGNFVANASGNATLQAKVAEPLSMIQSISIRVAPDQPLAACASIPQ
jgi:hypothetical protein